MSHYSISNKVSFAASVSSSNILKKYDFKGVRTLLDKVPGIVDQLASVYRVNDLTNENNVRI